MNEPAMTEARLTPLQPDERAPDFSLPGANRDETVSLAEYRGRSPLFLALFIGLWCPFCRRSIAQMGTLEGQLKAVGVETLGVVATAPENARLYFKYRPTRLRLAAGTPRQKRLTRRGWRKAREGAYCEPKGAASRSVCPPSGKLRARP